MITKDQVKHLAELAKLNLDEKEIESLTQDLNKILNYVEKINELDLSNVEPLVSILEKLNLRDDKVFESDSLEPNSLNLIKENFPQKQDNYLKVPKILEK